MLPIQGTHFPFYFLYAELHYRFFPFFPSLLFKREPEVVFDAPCRLNPGEDLPILLLINDIDRFPAVPLEVAVTVSQTGTATQRFDFNQLDEAKIDHPLHISQTAFLFTIPHEKLPSGDLYINATVMLQCLRKKITIFNDNIPGSSKRAFHCFRSDDALPGDPFCSYGDLHVHSQFSQSHVEFGPPLAIIDRMAKSCGLTFIGISDHSYDLSCTISNYLDEDAALERWRLLKAELANPASFSTIMIPGEEISCVNSSGATVHLVGLGLKDFVPGSGDGARHHRVFMEQLPITMAVDRIHQQHGIAFAAHPCARSGLLQQLLLHRGRWSQKDFTTPIDGFQALNSGLTRSWTEGKSLWIELLKQGRCIPLLAGNDAHGDFSRYRAIKTPFVSIYENFQRFMGYGKTGIYSDCPSQDVILQQIRKGATFITTGPYLSINHSENPRDYAVGSQALNGAMIKKFHMHAVSTAEFGTLRNISLVNGTRSRTSENEKILFSTRLQRNSYEARIPVDCSTIAHNSYLRAEVESETPDGIIHRAFTSAIFI